MESSIDNPLPKSVLGSWESLIPHMDKYKLRVKSIGVQPHNPFTLEDLSADCVVKTLVLNNPKILGPKLLLKLVKTEILPKTLVNTLSKQFRPIYRWTGLFEYQYFFDSYYAFVTTEDLTNKLTVTNYSYLEKKIPIDLLKHGVFIHDSWVEKYC